MQISKFCGKLEVEENDGFRHQAAVLGAAERKDIHTSLPGNFGWRDIERRQRISESGAIHMDFKAVFLSQITDRVQFGWLVQGAQLGGLRQTQGTGLGMVGNALAIDMARQLFAGYLSVITIDRDQLGAAGEELGGAAFVGVDMRNPVTVNGAVNRRYRRQGQGICNRPGGCQKRGPGA